MSLLESRKPLQYATETRTVAGYAIRCQRRGLTFLEEIAISAACRDANKRLQFMDVLAHVVAIGVKDLEQSLLDAEGKPTKWEPLELGLERCRALSEDAELAFFFIDWFAQDTIRHLTGQKQEELQKKS